MDADSPPGPPNWPQAPPVSRRTSSVSCSPSPGRGPSRPCRPRAAFTRAWNTRQRRSFSCTRTELEAERSAAWLSSSAAAYKYFGASRAPARSPGHRALPVVGDHAVTFTKQISQLAVRQQRLGHVPRGVHRFRQPRTDLLAAPGRRPKIRLHSRDLPRLTAAFHEQDSCGLDRPLVVEIRSPRERAQDRGRGWDGRLPALREREQRPRSALKRDRVDERHVGVVLLVLAMVLAEVADDRQQRSASAHPRLRRQRPDVARRRAIVKCCGWQ